MLQIGVNSIDVFLGIPSRTMCENQEALSKINMAIPSGVFWSMCSRKPPQIDFCAVAIGQVFPPSFLCKSIAEILLLSLADVKEHPRAIYRVAAINLIYTPVFVA